MSSSSASESIEIATLRRTYERVKSLQTSNLKSLPSTIPQLESQISDLERESSDPTFWDDSNSKRNKSVTQQLSTLNRLVNRINQWNEWEGDAATAFEILDDSECDDETRTLMIAEAEVSIGDLERDCEAYELELLLSGPYDEKPCRMVLTAGAGGTEACDWVDMLQRMYRRHADGMGYQVKVVETSAQT